MVGNSSDETNFLHKLLLTNTQVSRLRKAFATGPSANIKISKTQLSKMIQLGGLLPFSFDPYKALESVNEKVLKLIKEKFSNSKKNL